MKLIKIKPSDTPIWCSVWELYTSSFPEYERRGQLSHNNAIESEYFNTEIAVDNDNNLLALLFYWKVDGVIYIEHLSVNPLHRGNSIGTRLMTMLINQNKEYKIILEIEPPITEQTKRRLSFYKKLGFMHNPYEYTHPSYSKIPFIYRLDILSYPNQLTQVEYDQFCNFISNVILSYIE